MQEFTIRIEKAAIHRSLENLMTFPFVRKLVETGALNLHGAYFGVAEGSLFVLDQAAKEFHSVREVVGESANGEWRIEYRHSLLGTSHSPGSYAAFFLALISLRLIRHSAIWIAFSAAPLRRLSDTHHSTRPFSTVVSSRMRLI